MANGKSSIQEKLLAEMKRLRESFKIFDDDGGGTVGYDEFVECMDTGELFCVIKMQREYVRAVRGEDWGLCVKSQIKRETLKAQVS